MASKIVPLDKANKAQCIDAIDYLLKLNCVESVIKYTERLYEIVDFEAEFMLKGK